MKKAVRYDPEIARLMNIRYMLADFKKPIQDRAVKVDLYCHREIMKLEKQLRKTGSKPSVTEDEK